MEDNLYLTALHNYAVAARVSSTLMALIGVVTNGLVVCLSEKKNDNMNYVTLMRIYASLNVLRLLTGWAVLMRVHGMDGYTVFFIYGWGYLLPKFVCFLIDTTCIILIEMTTILVPVCMLFRCLILYDIRPASYHVYLSILIVFILSVPLGISTYVGYIEDFPSIYELNNSSYFIKETAAIPYYVVDTSSPWQHWVTFFSLSISYPVLPVTLVLRFIMLRHLNRYKKSMSPSTKELHRNFIKLLTLDSSILLIGIFIFAIQQAITRKIFSEATLIILTLYTFSIFALIPIIQGCATLYWVSYLRLRLKSFFQESWKHSDDNHSVASVDNR